METLDEQIAAVRAEIHAIHASDRSMDKHGRDNAFLLDRAIRRLSQLQDQRYGTKQVTTLAPVPPLQRKPRRKLPRSVSRNLCKCDLERFKDELSPGQFSADGKLSASTLAVKPPRMPKARSVQTLCAGCHLPHLFEHAARWGKSPVEYVTVFHGFTVDHDAAEWLETKYAEWKESK